MSSAVAAAAGLDGWPSSRCDTGGATGARVGRGGGRGGGGRGGNVEARACVGAVSAGGGKVEEAVSAKRLRARKWGGAVGTATTAAFLLDVAN